MTTTTINGTGRRITTKEATVKTAAVEIKALTVSGKQVTLAVFRQLEEEKLIDPETCELHGVPWGRVNYHSQCSGCLGDDPHLIVVWQKGTELRRAYVRKTVPPSVARAKFAQDIRMGLNVALALVSLRVDGQLPAGWKISSDDIYASYLGNQFGLHDPVRGWLNVRGSAWAGSETQRERREQLVEWLESDGWSRRPVDDAFEMVRVSVTLAEEHVARWRAQYEALAALDQLFIAV